MFSGSDTDAQFVANGCIKPVLLSVEAIIGAGKSTLLEELDMRSDIVVVREPMELWERERGGQSLLGRYYADQKSNAFMFETYAMMSRVRALQLSLAAVTPETRAIVMERSWLSSRRCFAENSQELGHLDTLESSLHEDIYNWGLGAWPNIDGVVFLDVSVDVAQARVASRGRAAESNIPSDYQGALMAKHRHWLCGEGVGAFGGAVLTLDANADKRDGAVDAMTQRVVEFVEHLHAVRQKVDKENLNLARVSKTQTPCGQKRSNDVTPEKSAMTMSGASDVCIGASGRALQKAGQQA